MIEKLKDKLKNYDENRGVPTVIMLFLRIGIGLYLIYNGYTMIQGEYGNLNFLFYIIAAFFILFGVGAAAMGIRDIIIGRYAGGPGEPK